MGCKRDMSHLKISPVLKWAGGKRKLLPELNSHKPKCFNVYYEPFAGAGALLFSLQPPKAVINDLNTELINTYKVIKTDVESLIERLKLHRENFCEAYYYQIRDLDRDAESFNALDDLARAARTILLNKTCFNGLYRVNSKGQFNTPWNRAKGAPSLVKEKNIKAMSAYLRANDVKLMAGDYESALGQAAAGDFIYLDPPYDTLSLTAAFTGYTGNGFGKTEQLRLSKVFKDLVKRDCHVMLSNHNTEYIRGLYDGFKIKVVYASRVINSNGKKRFPIEEVIITNY